MPLLSRRAILGYGTHGYFPAEPSHSSGAEGASWGAILRGTFSSRRGTAFSDLHCAQTRLFEEVLAAGRLPKDRSGSRRPGKALSEDSSEDSDSSSPDSQDDFGLAEACGSYVREREEKSATNPPSFRNPGEAPRFNSRNRTLRKRARKDLRQDERHLRPSEAGTVLYPEGLRVLTLCGHGLGFSARFLARVLPNSRVWGLHLSREQWLRAANLNEADGLGRLITSDWMDLGPGHAIGFEDGFFDLVWCTEGLDQVSEPESLVRELLRVLRPGGSFFLSGLCSRSSRSRAPALPRRQGHQELMHETRNRLLGLVLPASPEEQRVLDHLCAELRLAPLPRADELKDLVQAEARGSVVAESWSLEVARTWAEASVRALRSLPWVFAEKGFAEALEVLRDVLAWRRLNKALRSGVVKYMVFTGRKPLAESREDGEKEGLVDS